jgi:hypothetical protein
MSRKWCARLIIGMVQWASARRGLKNITIHTLLCTIAMLITALAAVMLERVEKAISITLLGR